MLLAQSHGLWPILDCCAINPKMMYEDNLYTCMILAILFTSAFLDLPRHPYFQYKHLLNSQCPALHAAVEVPPAGLIHSLVRLFAHSSHALQSADKVCCSKHSMAEESVEKRIRRCWLASALVALSQGIAFFHAGDEILRSKSLDRDSYNSGARLNPDLCNQTVLHE